jgi:uncharacterized protein (TIGR02996 family)
MPTTQEEAFLQDIVANADDDTPRLIYADWLSDHGDADRGDLIRVQCELARLPPADARRPDLERREQQLLRANKERWLAPLKKFVPRPELHRGFLKRVTLTAQTFLKSYEELFSLGPVQHVRLIDVKRNRFRADGTRAVQELADCPALAWVVSLSLSGNTVGAAQMAALVGSPHLRRVHALDLGGNPLGLAGLRAVLASPNLAGLTTLDLGGCYGLSSLGDGPLRVLAEGPWPPRLAHLDLSSNRFGAGDGVAAFAASPCCERLRSLDLGNNRRLGWGQVRQLAASPRLAGLERLSLAHSRLVDDDLGWLRSEWRLTGLRELLLTRCRLNERAALALAGCPGLERLALLDVRENALGAGAAALTERFGDRVRLG